MRYTNGDPLTARDEVLLEGLIDWVELDAVHGYVAQENVGQPPEVIQNKTLDLIRSLVSDGLFEVGEIPDANSRFVGWDTSLDDSLQRIRNVYVTDFADPDRWSWFCWLDLTDQGRRVAEAVEANTDATNGN